MRLIHYDAIVVILSQVVSPTVGAVMFHDWFVHYCFVSGKGYSSDEYCREHRNEGVRCLESSDYGVVGRWLVTVSHVLWHLHE